MLSGTRHLVLRSFVIAALAGAGNVAESWVEVFMSLEPRWWATAAAGAVMGLLFLPIRSRVERLRNS